MPSVKCTVRKAEEPTAVGMTTLSSYARPIAKNSTRALTRGQVEGCLSGAGGVRRGGKRSEEPDEQRNGC
jgi:hypothetical protein